MAILAVAQLFSYEDFPTVLSNYLPFSSMVIPSVLAALIVSFEVLSIPFLLSMRLSPAMRVLSMVSGWAVIVIWLLLLVPANLGLVAVASGGMLGATLAEPISWWLVVRIVALGVLLAWAAWGMWPLQAKANKKDQADA